jgi:hypothetical protein
VFFPCFDGSVPLRDWTGVMFRCKYFLGGNVCIKRYILVCPLSGQLSVTKPQCMFLSLFDLCIKKHVVGKTVVGHYRLALTGQGCESKKPCCAVQSTLVWCSYGVSTSPLLKFSINGAVFSIWNTLLIIQKILCQ